MKKEIQTKRRVSLSDSWAAYAKSISPKGAISDGLRVALDWYMRTSDIHPDCPTCNDGESFKPTHSGSSRCKSGSIASGGNKAHCSCDTCF